VWFLVLAVGAFLVHRAHAPAPVAALLAVPPPVEAKLAVYFLTAALLRLVIHDARVAALRRKARRDARRARPKEERPALLDVGAGVGKGVAEVLLGADILGAAIATLAAFFRLLWRSTRLDPSELARRARDRERKIVREGRRAAACIAAVGLVCAALAWAPWWQPRLPAQVARVAGALPGIKSAVARVTHPGRP